MVQLCPNVTSASIYSRSSSDSLSDEYLQRFASGWRKSLTEVDIFGNREVTGAGLIQFVSIANRLQSISISGIPSLTDSDIDVITGVLGNSLKSITFGFEQENLSGLAIQSISRNCPQLEEINIQKRMHIGFLKNLANLRRLTFKGSDPESFAEGFCRPFAHLSYLYIWPFKGMSDSLLTLIANSCPVLETFHFWAYQSPFVATDAGMTEIVDNCRCLTSLFLTEIRFLTGQSFIGAREKLPRLRVLYFSSCPNLNVDVLKTEFAGVEGVKIYRDGVDIVSGRNFSPFCAIDFPDVDVLKAEFAGVKGLKIHLNKVDIFNS